jgi:hypothetical protein
MSLDFSLQFEGDWVFSRNITHNLNRMAGEAGIYKCLWHPAENGYNVASDCITPLEKGLLELIAKKKHYESFNSSNGWGMYEHFVPFVVAVLSACHEYPTATIDSNI